MSKKPTRIVILGAGGSTGKTTSLVNIACEIARRKAMTAKTMGVEGTPTKKRRVRIWDGDKQGDASQYLHYTEPPFVIGDVLGDLEVFPDPTAPTGRRVPSMREIELPLYRETEEEAEEFGGLAPETPEQAEWLQLMTIIPSGIGPTGGNLGSAVSKMEREPMGHQKVLHALDSIDEGRPDDEIPDIEFFDLHGTVNPFSYIALQWAAKGGDEFGKSGVILVVTLDDKATGRHLKEGMDIIKEVAQYCSIQAVAIVPVRVKPPQAGKFYIEMYERLKGHETYGPMVSAPVREAVTVPESFAARQPLLMYVPKDPVTTDQSAVVDWLVEQKVVVI